MMTTKYVQDYYNFLALMCLIHCLVPPVPLLDFKFSKSIRVDNESKVRIRNRGKIFQIGTLERQWSKIDTFLESTTNARFSGSNFYAYIYTEIEHVPTTAAVGRRNLAENSTFAAAAAGRVVNELSLEDIDLIDCLWRQDIDAEKGVFSSIQPPEYQYQTDLVVLSEKNVLQSVNFSSFAVKNSFFGQQVTFFMPEYLANENRLQLSVVGREISPEIDSDRGFLSNEDYKYLKETLIGDFSTMDNENGVVKEDPLFSDYGNASWLNRGAPCPYGIANNGSGSDFSHLNNILNNNTISNETAIDYAKNSTFQAGIGSSNDEGYESTYLSSPFNEFFNEKQEKMLAFWDDSTENRMSTMQRLSESSTTSLMTQMDTVIDLDTLPTPHLNLTNQDIAQLFTDEQIMTDVAESYQTTKIAAPSLVQPSRSFTPFSDHSSSSSYLSSSGDIAEFRIRDELGAQNHGLWFGTSEPSTSSGHRSSFPLSTRPRNTDSQSSFASSTSAFHESVAIGSDLIAHDHSYFSMAGNENTIPQRIFKQEIVEKVNQEIEEAEEGEIPLTRQQHEVWVGAEEIAPPSTSTSRYQLTSNLAAQQQQERPQVFAPSRRDEDLLRQYRITLSAWDVNNMPAEELQRLLNVGGYSPGQAEIIRAVRRRGRNKVAAQFCRQRRYDAVRRLETEVEILQQELEVLSEKREQLLKEKDDELRAIEKLRKEM